MINQIINTYSLVPLYERQVKALTPFSTSSWDSTVGQMVLIRGNIKHQLMQNQNSRCCYCGLKLGETSRVEVEHIAPKAGRKGSFPQYSYYKYNLAAICQFCNSSSKKGEYNPIIKESPVYKKCSFEIVHPYFDNPNDFYEWKENSIGILISAKNGINKTKALKSIETFELDSEGHTEARAKEYYWERKKQGYALTDEIINLINKILNYRR